MVGDTRSESQETSSTLIEDSWNISFQSISYYVRDGIFGEGRKVILNDMYGAFNAGELTVILGQSGAGKSSLMDILAGYTEASNGRILVNGQVRNDRLFRRRSCYILQDCQVQGMLTIDESLRIAAELKLGNHISSALKHQRIEEIITSLSLDKVRHTRAGSLSGGQKKRLALGLELVSDPPVMFLDEPTSGLDSSISKQIMYLLHLLARQGRTVIITLHQPSAALLQMVDRLYAIVGGKCAYIGSVPLLLPYLERLNLTCPPYHNPVDYLIEICVNNADLLVEQSQNGRNMNWLTNVSQETDDNIKEEYNKSISVEVYLTVLPVPKEDPTRKILIAIQGTYPTSFWKQFITLTRRAMLISWRDLSTTLMMTGIHCCIALCMGVLYYNVGEDAKYVRDNYNFLYFSLMFLMFTAYSAVSINFPEQFPYVRREHFNRWYSTGAFYASTLVAAIPTQTVCTLVYACIAYWLTGQPLDFRRFFGFSWILVLVTYVALCLGFFNGSMFDIKNAVIFGPFIIMPFVVFSGFFLRYTDAPSFFHWIFHISFLKHGLVGLALSIFGMDRPKLPCSDIYCHYAYPTQFLDDNGMSAEEYSFTIVALGSIVTVIVVFSYFILKFRLKGKWYGLRFF